MKKILFILPNLNTGGAQRVVSFLSRKINSDIFNVKLIVLGVKKKTDFNVEGVDVVFLNKKRLLEAIPSLFKIFLKEKPNVVFGTIVHVNKMLGGFAFFFRKIKFIGRESSVYSERVKYIKNSKPENITLMRFLYGNLAKVVCQSVDMKNDLIEVLNLPASKFVVINNPLTSQEKYKCIDVKSDKLTFITIARLSNEKGVLRILECLSKIKNYEFEYTLIGNGSLYDDVMYAVEKFNLQSKFKYVSHTNEVLEHLKKHDYFLQGSYVEGFPNTLLESCSVGTPFIAFNVPGGTKEIFEAGVNGYLVDDKEAYINILKNIQEVKKLDREKVRASVVKKFSIETILKQYEDLFLEVANR